MALPTPTIDKVAAYFVVLEILTTSESSDVNVRFPVLSDFGWMVNVDPPRTLFRSGRFVMTGANESFVTVTTKDLLEGR